MSRRTGLGIGVAAQSGDKTTSVWLVGKSFSIRLIGLLMGDAVGPTKQSNKYLLCLAIWVIGTIYLEALSVGQAARPALGSFGFSVKM